MKKNLSLCLAVIGTLAASFTFTSCEIDNLSKKDGSSGPVLIQVAADAGVETKSVSQEQILSTVDISTDELPFIFSVSRSFYTETPFVESVRTKGEIVTTDSINDEGQSFNLYIDKDGKSYTPSAAVATYNKNGVETKWPLTPEVDWDDDQSELEFWAYSYSDPDSYSKKSNSNFDYVGVAPGGNSNDAALMSDFLVANTITNRNNVNIRFYHALAAVRFNIGEKFFQMTYKDKEGNELPSQYKSIKVRLQVKNKGNATFNKGNWDNSPENAFTWTGQDNVVAYEQTLYSNPDSDTDNPMDYIVGEADRTFFFVPQNANDEVLMSFIIVNAQGKEYILSTKTLGVEDWKAGYIYNYTIGNNTEGSVGVAVSESFPDGQNADDCNTKSSVKVSLTSSSAAYIRVAIVANWYTNPTGPGSIAKLYSDYTANAEIENNIQATNTDWKKYGDYWYYKYPVLGYSDSGELLKNFSCTATQPVDSPYDLHVEMSIVAQAVTFDVRNGKPYSAAWAWFQKANEEKDYYDPDGNTWFCGFVSTELKKD